MEELTIAMTTADALTMSLTLGLVILSGIGMFAFFISRNINALMEEVDRLQELNYRQYVDNKMLLELILSDLRNN
jgi:TRAP-type C4-dicarboxylate transport system permease small subunit